MKKLLACLSVVFLFFVFSGMAKAVTFNFDPPALPDDSNSSAIGTYMTGIYGSSVSVTGHNGPVSETGLFTLLGGHNDGYIESESSRLFGGQNLIAINFAVPITSVSFDWGQILDQFHADYSLDGVNFTNFFSNGYSLLDTGHFNTMNFASPVTALRFHDDGIGEVGIDNLAVTQAPEPASILLLGLGLMGLAGARRKFKE